jgi:hypothetical protein
MNKRFAIAGIIAFAFLLFNVSSSHADTISVTQPGATDGFGSTYMLSANCTGSVCNVTLTIDSTNATNPDISAVDFKIGSSDTFSGTVAAPNGTWNTSSGSLGNGGCGNNSGGFICSQAASTSSFAATGGILTWSWTGVDVTGDLTINHVGYKYDNGAGTLNGMIVSDSTFGNGGGGGGTSVPEPGVLQLLGVGLVGLGVMRRRFLNF